MKIALLGLGTVGKTVFDILQDKSLPFLKKYNIDVKYVLVRNVHNKNISSNLLVTDYNKILNDSSIEVVIEMMGADVSYDYMKKALLASKHVITANKEVIANHYLKLQEIAMRNHVNLLFEASVGGGIPIVHTLLTGTSYNHITNIKGILNGTTNFILTSMFEEKIEFEEALKIAQEKGFAEADPTADLEGLDMVRKIAILSMIAYHAPIDLNRIEHSGIKNITKEIVEILDLLDYKLKFIATSNLTEDGLAISVEPVVLKKTELLSTVNYEYNLVLYTGDACATQMMYGKGAGQATAHAILFDLELLLSGYYQSFMPTDKVNYLNKKQMVSRYIIKPKNKLSKKWIDKYLGTMMITKPISKEELESLESEIEFYAKIE